VSKEFQKELARRIDVLTNPELHDNSFKPLQKIDYAMIGLSVLVSVLVFLWGWL